jgi:putative FmdB family regulatory protein
MPLYDYKCRACNLAEQRLAGIDDRTLLCTECGEVMDRQISDDEAFRFYFNEPASEEASNAG